jgi:CHAT domain-containing protein
MIPSAASLRTLRQLPPGSSDRELFIGFGDPYFTKQQAAEAEQTTATAAETTLVASRGVRSHRRATTQVSADLFDHMRRLPETADELRSVAAALAVDPAKTLYLGRQASEKNVKTLNLAKYRFIEFATHGLLPSKEFGLQQPAIALAGPEVTGIKGDGLLTMEEVLSLKLNADWVVLSACNSGAGAAEGAEAVSGLGRAFFYAGTRALLVTNWAVDSASARDLVTGIFHALATDPRLSRAEALRRAMIALIDGPGYVKENGETDYTYAHPFYWAPYTIVGDGGGSAQ